jgi:hypothetical protein
MLSRFTQDIFTILDFGSDTLLPALIKLLDTLLENIFQHFCQCSCHLQVILSEHFLIVKIKTNVGVKSREYAGFSEAVTLCLAVYFRPLTTCAGVFSCRRNRLFCAHFSDFPFSVRLWGNGILRYASLVAIRPSRITSRWTCPCSEIPVIQRSPQPLHTIIRQLPTAVLIYSPIPLPSTLCSCMPVCCFFSHIVCGSSQCSSVASYGYRS